jgi:hypothetical protein
MSDIVLPVPKTYLEKFLKPVSRISESCILKFSEDLLYTVCAPPNNSLILYAAIKLPIKVEAQKLNIINIKKLLTGFDCLGDDGEFSMVLNKNHIKCEMFDSDTNDGVHFKYHLVDDGIIKESTVNIQKIAKLKFDTEFEIFPEKIKKIISAYSFASDASKIYFYSKNKKIYGEIDDKTIQNIDNLSLLISPKTIGEDLQNPLPINIEIFKNLSMTKNPVKVKINNEFNVFVFQVQEEENIDLKYIVSALVK